MKEELPACQPTPELQEIVQRLLDHEGTLADVSELNAILPRDPDALRYFVKMRMLHGSLEQKLDGGGKELISIEGRDEGSEEAAQGGRLLAFPRSVLWVAAAVVLLSAGLGGLWMWQMAPTDFTVVAASGLPAKSSLSLGTVLRKGQRIELGRGMLEFQSPDGNSFTFEAPCSFRVNSSSSLVVENGMLWADLQGAPMEVHTPGGRITDLGTTFGLDQSRTAGIRVDLFDGRVRLDAPVDGQQLSQELEEGKALIFDGKNWPPKEEDADASRYADSLRKPVGIAFAKNEEEAERIQGELPFGSRWTAVTSSTGCVQPDGASFEFLWAGESFYATGGSDSSEAALFHTHLHSWYWNDEKKAPGKKLGLPVENHGIVMRFKGMHGWMKESGAQGYRVEVFRNSTVPDVFFSQLVAYRGMDEPGEETLLARQHLMRRNYFGPNYPEPGEGQGARAIGMFDEPFREDVLTLVLPANTKREELTRNNVAAVRVTPVY